jgi:hypothetical protein
MQNNSLHPSNLINYGIILNKRDNYIEFRLNYNLNKWISLIYSSDLKTINLNEFINIIELNLFEFNCVDLKKKVRLVEDTNLIMNISDSNNINEPMERIVFKQVI